MQFLAWLISLPIVAEAGDVLWSGLFNESAAVADFDKCKSKLSLWKIYPNFPGSWSNQIGDWQWYIHGTADTDTYLGLSADYKNPADSRDAQGIRITIVGLQSAQMPTT